MNHEIYDILVKAFAHALVVAESDKENIYPNTQLGGVHCTFISICGYLLREDAGFDYIAFLKDINDEVLGGI